jgi:hypothetical protein
MMKLELKLPIPYSRPRYGITLVLILTATAGLHSRRIPFVLFKFEVPVDPGWTLTRITDFRVYFNNQETVIPESSLPAIMYSR